LVATTRGALADEIIDGTVQLLRRNDRRFWHFSEPIGTQVVLRSSVARGLSHIRTVQGTRRCPRTTEKKCQRRKVSRPDPRVAPEARYDQICEL